MAVVIFVYSVKLSYEYWELNIYYIFSSRIESLLIKSNSNYFLNFGKRKNAQKKWLHEQRHRKMLFFEHHR